VRGALDHRCFYGAPWRIDFAPSEPGEIPYHEILGGSALPEVSDGGLAQPLIPGDIVLLPSGAAHALHDGSTRAPTAERRRMLNVLVHENNGTGDRLDMMCGRFVVSSAHERLIRAYLPGRLVVRAAENSAAVAAPGTRAQVGGHQLFLAPSFIVADDLAAGRLVPLMPDYRSAPFEINAVYPHRHQLSAKVRVFIDLLVERFAEHRKWMS
jgi:DNA-binding transcriptional LysR family regulator